MLRAALAISVTSLAGCLTAAPAMAAPASTVFDAPALDDQQLSEVRGMGLTKAGLVQTEAREHFDTFSGQVATILPLTFDNWFNDVGTPLIVANINR